MLQEKSIISTTNFQTRCSCIICKHETTTQSFKNHLKRHEPKEIIFKPCKKCGNLHSKSGPFCSRSCGNSRKMSNGQKIKISKILKGTTNPYKGKTLKHFSKVSQCEVCDKWFKIVKGYKKTCSIECKSISLSNSGKRSASINVKRSKDEMELFTLCSGHFQNIEHNQSIFNGWDADIIVHDFKLAILWNGPWHYKEMNMKNHSLLQVQNRDNIKISEIRKYGYTPLIFEDRYYTPLEAFEEIKKRALDSNQDYALDVSSL